MQLWILIFLIGNSSILFLKHIPAIYIGYLLLISSIALTFFIPRNHLWFSLLLAAIIGFSWSVIHANKELSMQLPADWETKRLITTGYINNIPELKDQRVEFIYAINTVNNLALEKPFLAKLSWHLSQPIRLNTGDKWQLTIKIKRPRGFWDAGVFDYEKWLFEHNIRATGYVVNNQNNQLLLGQQKHTFLNRIREHIANSITEQLNNHPLTGLINALATGVRYQITQVQWQLLRGTGTNHLFAIAGLHIGFIAGFIYFIVNFIWRRLGNLPLYIPTPQAAALSALIAAAIYSGLAGFSLPTQRAIIMFGVFLLATLLRKNLLAWTSWCIALLIVLAIEPLAILSDSFWLSFIAVAIILYGINGRLAMRGFWWHWGRTQWVIALGLIPLSLLFFHEVSLGSFIANAIAIPWVGFVVLPLCLAGSFLNLIFPYPGKLLLITAAKALGLIWPLLTAIANIKFLQWQVNISNSWIFISASIGTLLLLAPRGLPGRWLGFIWLLPIIFYKPAGPKPGELWLTLLDVGQGLSTVVRTANHVLVYDTGPKYSANFDTGNAVVIPYLNYIGVKQIDTMVISHPDNDHIGGANSILMQMPVTNILTNNPEKFKKAMQCEAGQQWEWDGINFQIIYPSPDRKNLDNDSSCVLRIDNGTQSILLTGDIERSSEQYLIKNNYNSLDTTILVAPHHGSITSSSPLFVQAVHPNYILFPVGYLNRYHFPNPKVVMRYKAIGAKIYDTVIDGMVTFVINRKTISSITTYREKYKKFWH